MRAVNSRHAALLVLAALRVLGGEGSGNFGHAGRPGEVGGSAPSDAHAGAPAVGHSAHAPEWPIDETTVREMGSSTPFDLNRSGREWARTLSPEQQDALSRYLNNDYAAMNEKLRTTGLDAETQVIQDALATSPKPPPPDLVWRGVGGGPLATAAFLKQAHVGDVVTLDGFQSSSIRPEFVETWSNRAVFEIKPKAGAYVRSLSEHPTEYEYLLPHGKQYRVMGVANVPIKNSDGKVQHQTVVQLEML